MRRILSFILVICIGFTAFAQKPADEPVLSETEIEMQAREIGRALRCVVCQNQSIEESDAPLAADMRALVRERLQAGDDAEEIKTYMRDRYGDFVLLKPPVQPNTYVLWAAPFVLLVLLLLWWFRQMGRRDPDMEKSRREDGDL